MKNPMPIPMKHTFITLSLLAVSLTLGSCMNDFDDLDYAGATEFPYGNNALSLEVPITTIDALKNEIYPELFQSTAKFNYQYTHVNDDIYIRGRIVSNDESGNVYKNIAIQDETGCIIIGVNATGLYSCLPMGQKVLVSLKGLDFGAYSNMPEIGMAYENSSYGLQLGRISEQTFLKHIRLIGNPDPTEILPEVLTESQLKSLTATDYPRYVILKDVTFADGGKPYAPNDGATEDRYVNLGSQKIDCRMSSYANFAGDTIPKGKVDVIGLLTLYGSTKQMLVRVADDIIVK